MRALRGVTQEEVAHRAGVHVTYLSGIERGVRNPSLKNIRALAKALNVSTADLFAFELEDDAEDVAAFEERADEPDLSYGDVVDDLRRRGKL